MVDQTMTKELQDLWTLVGELENVSARLRKAADAALEALEKENKDAGGT